MSGNGGGPGRLVSHHVGGRAGTRAYPVLAAFERDLVNVLYEADEGCIGQIVERTATLPSQTIVMPVCLSDREGKRDFHIYKDQYLSSLHPIRRSWAETYRFDGHLGWDCDPVAMSILRTIEIETRSLDSIARDESVPPPDFLSLDTQGSELEILRGAEETLRNTVVAVETEVWLQPMYKGQCLYPEVAAFLARLGFDLAVFRPLEITGASHRTPIGLRGAGRAIAAEAVFLKRPADLPDRQGDLRLLKLAFFTFMLDLFDETYALLRSMGAERLAHARDTEAPGCRYLEFLCAYREALATYPAIFPVAFGDVMTDELIARRFKDGPSTVDVTPIRERYFSGTSRDDFTRLAPHFAGDADIGVERVARAYGLDTQADLLKRVRIDQFSQTLTRLGIRLSPD